MTGIRGPQFTYDLSFMPVADATDGQIVERHDTLAVILRTEDVEKLDGASLTLSDEGLAMNNPAISFSPVGEDGVYWRAAAERRASRGAGSRR